MSGVLSVITWNRAPLLRTSVDSECSNGMLELLLASMPVQILSVVLSLANSKR